MSNSSKYPHATLQNLGQSKGDNINNPGTRDLARDIIRHQGQTLTLVTGLKTCLVLLDYLWDTGRDKSLDPSPPLSDVATLLYVCHDVY